MMIRCHRKINVLPKYTWLDVINDCRVTLEEIGSEYCADDCPNIKNCRKFWKKFGHYPAEFLGDVY